MSASSLVLALCILQSLPAPSADAGRQRCDVADFETAPRQLNAAGDAGSSLLQLGAGRKAVPPPAGGCGWRVWYDRWLPSFVQGEYEGPGSDGGAHCLAACCQDPSCKGLALMSGEMYQCYKYATPPSELAGDVGQPLGDGKWLGKLKPAWSIFVKADVAALTNLDAVPRERCDWSVHYDLWLNTFEPFEYEPPNAKGGANCLEACCQDPHCEGLALLSNEKYQCYRYRGLPTALATRQGVHLGDGEWLQRKPPAWSIFVKNPAKFATDIKNPAKFASGTSSGTHVAKSATLGETVARERVAAAIGKTSTSDWFVGALHFSVVAASIGAVAFLVCHFALADPRKLPIWCTKLGFKSGAPETKSLLQGIEIKPLRVEG